MNVSFGVACVVCVGFGAAGVAVGVVLDVNKLLKKLDIVFDIFVVIGMEELEAVEVCFSKFNPIVFSRL